MQTERRRARGYVARLIAAAALLLGAPPALLAQQTVVTSRPCQFGDGEPAPGPACLIARNDLGPLSTAAVYWHIDTFPDEASARRANVHNGSVVRDFGKVWLFTVAEQTWKASGGNHAATIGPLPTAPAASFTAEYVHSYFAPGTSAPIHKHSGPEAFYALDGDTCLEMPGDAHIGRGPGNTVIMPAGEPMLLMAVGKTPRRAFALVLHDTSLPATTRVDDWTPAGRCRAAL